MHLRGFFNLVFEMRFGFRFRFLIQKMTLPRHYLGRVTHYRGSVHTTVVESHATTLPFYTTATLPRHHHKMPNEDVA